MSLALGCRSYIAAHCIQAAVIVLEWTLGRDGREVSGKNTTSPTDGCCFKIHLFLPVLGRRGGENGNEMTPAISKG